MVSICFTYGAITLVKWLQLCDLNSIEAFPQLNFSTKSKLRQFWGLSSITYGEVVRNSSGVKCSLLDVVRWWCLIINEKIKETIQDIYRHTCNASISQKRRKHSPLGSDIVKTSEKQSVSFHYRFGNPDVLKISNSIRSVVEFTLYELRACFISFHSHAEKFFS